MKTVQCAWWWWRPACWRRRWCPRRSPLAATGLVGSGPRPSSRSTVGSSQGSAGISYTN